MKLAKQTLCVLLMVLASVSIFASGSAEQAGKASSDMEKAIQKVVVDKEPVEIEFWTGTGAENFTYLEKMVNAFMEEYPNIKVDFSNQGAIGELTNKLTQNIVSRTTPTLSNLNAATFPGYIEAEAIVDLMPYYNDATVGFTAEEKADFFQNYIEECKSFGPEGTMYAFPTNKKTTDILVYNKTLFDELGLSVPSTWDEVAEVSKAIYEATGKPGFSYDCSYGDAAFKTMSSQWGSPYVTKEGKVSIDNESSLQAVNFYKDNMDKGYFTLPPLLPSGGGGNYSNKGFVVEECFLFIGPAAGIQYDIPSAAKGQKEFEVGVAPVPQKNAENGVTFSKGENYAVFSNATEEQRVAAWLLIKFLSASENNVEWFVKTGNLPISQSMVENAEYQAFLATGKEAGNAYYKAIAAKAGLEMTSIMGYDIAFEKASELASEVGAMWKTILIGGADAKQTIAATQAKFN